jgi:hypothetical protein
MGTLNSEERRPAEGIRCPTCGARQGLSDTCRRCKSDLRLLRAAQDAYRRHRRESLGFLAAGDLERALGHARKCHELMPGAESNRLMAACHVLRGEWLDAVALARRNGNEAQV